MNAKQALRAASRHITELEYANSRYKADVIGYNNCILHMIRHGSPCDYCQDLAECKEAGKDVSIGCDDWLLMDILPTEHIDGEEASQVEVKGILPDGAEGGT